MPRYRVRAVVPRTGRRVADEEAKFSGAAAAAAGEVGAWGLECLPGVDAARLGMLIGAPDTETALAAALHIVAYACACADDAASWDLGAVTVVADPLIEGVA